MIGSSFGEEYMNVMVDHKSTVGQEHYVVTKKGGMILKSPETNIACMK